MSFKRFGYGWTDDGERYTGNDGSRFHPTTWKFGSIWQSCVAIDYEPPDDGHVWMCLNAQKTMNDAMRHAIAWIDNYKGSGPPSVEEVFADCYKNYKTLYRTRLDVIDHLFFVIGNGYDWLDGAIVSTSEPETKEMKDSRAIFKRDSSLDLDRKLSDGSFVFDEPFRKRMKRLTMSWEEREALMPLGPITEEEKAKEVAEDGIYTRRLYPTCEYSKVLCVPDDVRPDWLAVAYEAAQILATSSLDALGGDERGKKNNRENGIKVVAELEQRFPQLKS